MEMYRELYEFRVFFVLPGGIYTSVESILTTALTAIILIMAGFSMELTPELFICMHIAKK